MKKCTVVVKVDQHTKDAITAIAETQKRSRSNMIEKILADYIAAHGGPSGEAHSTKSGDAGDFDPI